jgi:hypothetical protein
MHKYELNCCLICPLDKKEIDYRISLTSEYLILVEAIEEFFKSYAVQALQEELVDDLKRKFPMATVTVVATHGRVRITSKK